MKPVPRHIGSFVLLTVLVSLSFIIPSFRTSADDNDAVIAPPTFADHGPISISGNSELLSRASSEGWPGTGTTVDPIQIGPYNIKANSQYGIYIRSTDLHIRISGCNITLASKDAIRLVDVKNANISDNIIYSNQGDGIVLASCTNCIVAHNLLEGAEVVNNYNGITLDGSANNLVEANKIVLCVNDGIGLFGASHDNMVRNNIVKENLNNGIEVQGDSNTIEANIILYNRAGIRLTGDHNRVLNNRPTQNGYGIELSNASANEVHQNVLVRNFQGIAVTVSYSNLFTSNYILKSFDYGIIINCNPKSGNTLYDNVLFYNNDTSSFFQKGLVQAKDVSGDSIWHSNQKSGNHWWDWRQPDNNEDLIVDFPYKLHGKGGSDPYPLLRSPIPDLFTPPGSLSAVPASDSINLSWTIPYYSLDIKVVHFNLYRSERGGGEFLYKQLDGRTTYFVDREVSPGRAYYYYITAWNGYAESNRSSRVKSSPDTKAPSVSISGPKEGDFINTSWVKLYWTGADNIKLDRYEISLDGGPFLDMGLNTTYVVPYLKDGTHSFVVRVFDLAEHMSQRGASFTVDTVMPDLIIDGGPGGSFVFDTDRPLIFFRGWDSLTDIREYRVRYHTYGWRSIGVTDSHRLDPVPDGIHNISLMAFDMAGNWRLRKVNITVDTTPPKFRLVSPLDGAFIRSEKILVSWVPMSDLTEPLKFQVRVDYDDWGAMTEGTSQTIWVTGEGEHGIELKAFDMAGNTKSITSGFTVDMTSPTVELRTPLDGSILNAPFFVEWKALDERSPLVLFRVLLDGSIVAEVEEGLPVTVPQISEGAHHIKVEAIDKAGNIGMAESNFLYDPNPPTIISVHPTGVDVDIHDFIRVAFSERMDPASVRIDGLPSDHKLVWEGSMVLNVQLSEPLSYSTHYVLSVHGTDEAKNQLLRFEWSFWTMKDPMSLFGWVLGRTVDTEGTPLANVTIRSKGGDRVQSGPDGTFVLAVPPGEGIITATKSDYLDTSVVYNVSEGRTVDLGDIPLRLVPSDIGGSGGQNYTLPFLFAAVVLIAIVVSIAIAYQAKRAREYERLPFNEKDEWVNVHDLNKK